MTTNQADALLNAIQHAVTGNLAPAHLFLAQRDAAYDAKRAAETKVVAWVTASGAVAISQPKTPADAATYAAHLIAQGKSDVEILDK